MSDASALERAKKKRYATPDIQKAILTMTAQEFELYAADYFNDEDQYETSLLGTLLAARLTAANARIAEVEAERDATCVWTCNSNEDDDHWSTTCGRLWLFGVGGPTENNVKFCLNCGKRVTVAEGAK